MAKSHTAAGQLVKIVRVVEGGWRYMFEGKPTSTKEFPSEQAALFGAEVAARNGAKDSSPPDVWAASFETGGSQMRSLGKTPEEAVEALIAAWQAACVLWNRGDPSLLHDARDSVCVDGFSIGRGYVLAGTDEFWTKHVLHGDDTRFDAVFEASKLDASASYSPK